MPKKIAIVQPNYIPWRGYFDLISFVDEFIILDDVQYTKRDWRNRNIIKTPKEPIWLSIPVKVKGKYKQKICEVEILDTKWKDSHWRTLKANYAKAPYFNEISQWLKPLYLENNDLFLSEININFIKKICAYLSINTAIYVSSSLSIPEVDKNERLLEIALQCNADEYVTGPSAKYLDQNLFSKNNILLTYFTYEGYNRYPQLWGDYIHQVSILDLLFNCGSSSKNYLRF